MTVQSEILSAGPLVSIVIPCYNQASWLPEALETVYGQTYQRWECIIVNDGSPDHTEAVAKEWCRKDTRFHYLAKTNGGLSSARNAGIRSAKGKYILPLDADDKISADYLSLGVAALEKDPSVTLLYGNAFYFGEKNEEWKLHSYSYKKLLLMNLIYCSAIYRKEDFDKTGGYCEALLHGLEDWEFWIGLLKQGGNVKKLDEVVFYYRIRQSSMLKSINPQIERAAYDLIFKKHIDTYLAYFENPIAVYAREHYSNDELKAIKNSRVYKWANSVIRLKQRMFGK